MRRRRKCRKGASRIYSVECDSLLTTLAQRVESRVRRGDYLFVDINTQASKKPSRETLRTFRNEIADLSYEVTCLIVSNVTLSLDTISILAELSIGRLEINKASISVAVMQALLALPNLGTVFVGKNTAKNGWKALREGLLMKDDILVKAPERIRFVKPSSNFLVTKLVLDERLVKMSSYFIARVFKGLEKVETMRKVELQSHFGSGSTLGQFLDEGQRLQLSRDRGYTYYTTEISLSTRAAKHFLLVQDVHFQVKLKISSSVVDYRKLASYILGSDAEVILNVSVSELYSRSERLQELVRLDLINNF